VEANGDALNFCVTPNHDMVLDCGKMEARALFDVSTSVAKAYVPISVRGSKPEVSVSDNAIELAAAFVCDGYRRPYGSFAISVSRDYKISALRRYGSNKTFHVRRATEDDVAITPTRTITTKFDKSVFGYDEEVLEGLVDMEKMFDRDLLASLSQRQAKLLVDTMVMFDGSDNGRGTMRFYSSRTSILCAFEVAAISAGYAISQRRARISDIGGTNYSITVSDKEMLPVIRCSASQIDRGHSGITMTEHNKSGEVWCCRVPSGIIVVRRNGLSMLCGNCAEAAALRAAFPEELGNDLTAEEMAGRTIDTTAVPHVEIPAFETPARPTAKEFERGPDAKAPKQPRKKKAAATGADQNEPPPHGDPVDDQAARKETPLQRGKRLLKTLNSARDVADLRNTIGDEIHPDEATEWGAACDVRSAEIVNGTKA
jgi:hypothetical protein